MMGYSIQESGRIHGSRKEIGCIRAAHKDLAVGEIDHTKGAIDHGVAHGNEGIDASLGQAKDDEVEPVTGRIGAPRQGGCRSYKD